VRCGGKYGEIISFREAMTRTNSEIAEEAARLSALVLQTHRYRTSLYAVKQI